MFWHKLTPLLIQGRFIMYNKWYLIPILFFAILIFSFSTVGAEETPEEKLIKTYHEDITGDGHKENISLYGTFLSNESEYFRDIWATITFPDQTVEKISYQGGYQPALTFVDMNQNGRYDILFTSTTNQENDTQHSRLHSIKRNKKPSEVELPAQDHINGKFQSKFKIELSISPIDEPKIINIKNQANQYIETGIYDHDGNLLKNISIHSQPIVKYEPVFLSTHKGYGLKSYRQINGMNKADKIGTIETLWYYEGSRWVILDSEWMENSH